MSKSDRVIEDYYTPPRGAPSDSQSPQAHRGSSQDHEQFSKGDVPGWAAPGKTDAANKGAWDNASPLEIEDVNEGAFPKRR
jgi:hypothetical protein